METIAGRSVMKPPLTRATSFILNGTADASGNYTLIFRAVDNHLATKYSKWSACYGRSYPYHIITYQSHTAGSVA